MYLLSAPYVKTSLSNIKGGIQMERNWPLLTSHQIQCPVWPLTRGTGDSFVLPRRNRWQFGTPSRAMTNMSCYHSKNIYFSDARHYSQIDISVISISGFNFGSIFTIHWTCVPKYVIVWCNTYFIRSGVF